MSTSQPAEEFLLQYTNCEARLFAYLMTLLGNRADAEEVYQETSLVLWRNFDEFQLGSDFFNWAKRIAFHRVLALRKKRQHSDVPGSEEFLNSVQQVLINRSDQLAERLQALSQCVDKLAVADRQLVASRYESNCTIKDLATQLGRPANTLYKAFQRIRQHLVECVDRSLAREGHA